MGEPIIQIRGLSKTFRQGDADVHALRDIRLDVEPGDIYGIIGLSEIGRAHV